MVSTQELAEEEVLECLRKILKGVSIVPLRVDEFTTEKPPSAVSLFLFSKELFLSAFFA
jgi:hypothetical protein